ncbi:Ubiquitin carboxyl-terminal hydrolase family protein [Acanthocheilonema viteae]
MFERLSFSPPSEKRSRQSEPPSEMKTKHIKPSLLVERVELSPSTDRLKFSSLQSEESEKIKREHDPTFAEYYKEGFSPVQLTPAICTPDNYKMDDYIIKPTTSKEKISGFANLGNTCYMNAMLQGLFAMDIFTRDLFKFCKKVQSRKINLDEVMPMSLALSSLASVRDRPLCLQKQELLKAVKDVSCFKGSAQQDANEFLVHVLNQIHDECDKVLRGQYGITDTTERRIRNPVMANFGFTTQSTIICDTCHHVSQVDEDSIILPVTISVLDQASERFSKKFLRFPNVQTLLDEFLKTENVERNCELCQGKSGQRTQKFVQLPRCLIILIKRYAYDVSKSVKRKDKIDIPLYLTLNGHCTESSVPFLAVPPSTKKIDFATASPIKTKLLGTSTNSPSPARRRLYLSDVQTSYDTRKASTAEEIHPAITSLYDRSMDYRTMQSNIAANHDVDFVVPDTGSSIKGEDQIIENFVVPRSSPEDFKRPRSPRSITCEELSRMTEEEQLKVICERSLLQTKFVINENKSSDSSSMSLEFPEVEAEEEEDEAEVPRAQTDDIYSSRKEKSGDKLNPDIRLSEEIGNERVGRSGQEVQSVSLQEEENSNENRAEPNSGAELGIASVIRGMSMEERVIVNADMNAERIKQDNCETKSGAAKESYVKPLTKSPVAYELVEEQRSENYAIKEIVAKNFDVLHLSQRETKIPAQDVQRAIENKRESTRPSTPVPPNTPTGMTEQDQEKMPGVNLSIDDDDDREILEESGVQVIPYKPMSVEKRRAVCSQIGLLFNYDCIEKTVVRVMNPNDRPSRVASIVGDGNCLFRALAFYFAGSDIEHSRVRECIVEFEAEHWNEFASLKGWSSDVWNDHMDHLLTDNTWGGDIELFAVAAMLNVDVWTYYDQRWICYRPRFKVQDGDVIPISVKDHRAGNNDGIYLLNEFNHYTPVLEPSNALLLMEGADERICDLVVNANEGFMKPSYRLVSVISHIGDKSESGHYICDIWCKKNKSWLQCNDEDVLAISETRVRARNNVGYIYFYLNSELFESENA